MRHDKDAAAELTALLLAKIEPYVSHEKLPEAIGEFFAAAYEVERKLVPPHVLSPDDTPNRVHLKLTYARDETADEAAEREAKQARRWRAQMWKPEDGPPPEGVGALQLLEQDVWWKPAAKEPLRLEDMTVGHRANLLAWLERRGARFKMHKEFDLIASCPEDPSDGVFWAFEDMQGELERKTAEHWLAEQPLIVKLRELVHVDKRPTERVKRLLRGERRG